MIACRGEKGEREEKNFEKRKSKKEDISPLLRYLGEGKEKKSAEKEEEAQVSLHAHI